MSKHSILERTESQKLLASNVIADGCKNNHDNLRGCETRRPTHDRAPSCHLSGKAINFEFLNMMKERNKVIVIVTLLGTTKSSLTVHHTLGLGRIRSYIYIYITDILRWKPPQTENRRPHFFTRIFNLPRIVVDSHYRVNIRQTNPKRVQLNIAHRVG